jgi:hypothetical protein
MSEQFTSIDSEIYDALTDVENDVYDADTVIEDNLSVSSLSDDDDEEKFDCNENTIDRKSVV